MIICTFKLRDAGHIVGMPKWNARIYKGEKFLDKDFFGDTEEIVRLQAKRFIGEVSSEDYQVELAKIIGERPSSVTDKASASHNESSHHFAGKVWLWKEGQGFKRVDPDQVSGLIAWGWVRKGPRSRD